MHSLILSEAASHWEKLPAALPVVNKIQIVTIHYSTQNAE